MNHIKVLNFSLKNLEHLREMKRAHSSSKFIFIFNEQNKNFVTISSKAGLDEYLIEPYTKHDLEKKITKLAENNTPSF
jgi:hypothetical protein